MNKLSHQSRELLFAIMDLRKAAPDAELKNRFQRLLESAQEIHNDLTARCTADNNNERKPK